MLYRVRKFRVEHGDTAGLYTPVDKMFLKAWDQAMGPAYHRHRVAYNRYVFAQKQPKALQFVNKCTRFKDDRRVGLDKGVGDEITEEIEGMNRIRLAKKHSWRHNFAEAMKDPTIAREITRDNRGKVFGNIQIYFNSRPQDMIYGNVPGQRAYVIRGDRAAEARDLRELEPRNLLSVSSEGNAVAAPNTVS